MMRIFVAAGGLLFLCGCGSSYDSWFYHTELQNDALKAAEYETMQTDGYRDRVEQGQRNIMMNKINNNNVIYRRY